MKRTFFIIAIVAFAMLANVNMKAQLPFQDLDLDTYFEINNYNDLYTLSQSYWWWAVNFELTADIRIPPGQNFHPIGDSSCPYNARFDGHGFKIIGATINRPNGHGTGLFGVNIGDIRNVTICNMSVTGYKQVGALCGLNGGKIENCQIYFDVANNNYSTTTVTGSSSVGGLVGANWGSIYSSKPTLTRLSQYTYVSVTGVDTTGGFVGDNHLNLNDTNHVYNCEIYNAQVNGSGYGIDFGGFAGYNCGIIANSLISGSSTVDAEYSDYIGGFAGVNTYQIMSSNAVTNVIGNSNVGGFLGYNSNNVSSCGSVGDVTAYGNYVGGFVGQTTGGTISTSYVGSGKYITAGDSYYVGGFAGYNSGTITNSCTKAVSVAGDYYVGGFIGYNYNTITNCYSRSNVAGSIDVGGFAGVNTSTGILRYCFSACTGITGTQPGGFLAYNNGGICYLCRWDSQSCGRLWSDGGDGLTTSQAKNASYYPSWSWGVIWEISGENGGYPSFLGIPIYKLNLPENKDNIEIYPNPVSDISTIKINEPQMGFVTISVYNINGDKMETLYSGNININDFTLNFNGSNYSSGMYYLIIESNMNRLMKTIVVKH
jgi:hypothetical protein